MTTGKTIALATQTFVGKMMSLLFNMLSRLVIAFLPRSKCVLISCSAVTVCSDFPVQENKICHCFHFFPFYLPCSDGTRCCDRDGCCVCELREGGATLECWLSNQLLHCPRSPASRGSLVYFHFLPSEWNHLHTIEVVDISPGNLDSSLWFIQPGTWHDVLYI